MIAGAFETLEKERQEIIKRLFLRSFHLIGEVRLRLKNQALGEAFRKLN